MTLISLNTIIRLTDGKEVVEEYTAPTHEGIARLAVARYQKDNPTKRVEHVRLPLTPPKTWLPHYEGWLDEQPEFIKEQTDVVVAPLKRDGRPLDPPNAADTELGAARTMDAGQAKDMGYTGNSCDICGSLEMKISGHCEVCSNCGTTTGCS